MALEDDTSLRVVLTGKTAAHFRLLLTLTRAEMHKKARTMAARELAAYIIERYLQLHERDILEATTDDTRLLAKTAIVRRNHTGLPGPSSGHRSRRTASVPQVPDAGGDTTAHAGGDTTPAAAAVGDQAAE